MDGFFKYRWFPWVMALLVLALGAALVVTQLPQEPTAAAGGALMAGLLLVLLVRIGVRNRHDHTWEQALSALRENRSVIFWKPGCMFCARLRRRLGRDERFLWINVYRDADADRELRRLNGGDQLTPTALLPRDAVGDAAEGAGRAAAETDPETGAVVLRNPSAAELRTKLTKHLLE